MYSAFEVSRPINTIATEDFLPLVSKTWGKRSILLPNFKLSKVLQLKPRKSMISSLSLSSFLQLNLRSDNDVAC